MHLAFLLVSCSLLVTSLVNAQNVTTSTTTAPTTTTTTTSSPGTGSTKATTTTTTSSPGTGSTKAPSKVVMSANEFAVSLFKAIGELSPGENLFLSPISISYGLSMLYAAAGGQTRTQLGTALRLVPNAEPRTVGKDFRDLIDSVNRNTSRYSLLLSSCLFMQRNFKINDVFLKAMNESYGTALENLDFDTDPDSARTRINGWIADRTSGIIKDVFGEDEITTASAMVLANAAYFKGYWQYPFSRNLTTTGKFSMSSRKSMSVQMMKQKQTQNLNYYNSSELGAQILELPYEGAFASMYILLPHTVDGLAQVENLTTPKTLTTAIGLLKEESVVLSMPKFALDRATSLMPALVKMGIADMFDLSKADLSGLYGSKRRAITDVVHKAYVSVDEDGKVSAALPAFGFYLEVESVKFKVNRPFLFGVVDKASGGIVFMGRVTKPALREKQA